MNTDKYNYNYTNNNNDKAFENTVMVVDGHYTCQQDRTQILNERISQRNIPSDNLEPSIGFRPVMTKYTTLPIVDQKAKSHVNISRYPVYSPHKTYNVGNRSAPWSGFASSVNVESTLRNQFFALQKCNQSDYIPSSNSDLYGLSVPVQENKQTHPLLFRQDEFHDFNPSNVEAQQVLFNNFTRQQLLNSCGNNNNNNVNNNK
jgi:hypothetical protein